MHVSVCVRVVHSRIMKYYAMERVRTISYTRRDNITSGGGGTHQRVQTSQLLDMIAGYDTGSDFDDDLGSESPERAIG